MVQWLRLCASNAEGLGSMPGQGTRFHLPQIMSVQPNKKKIFLIFFFFFPKKAEKHQRRSNKSILKGINPEYSLEGLMLKLQYFGHLMQRAEKTLMLGKIEGGIRG